MIRHRAFTATLAGVPLLALAVLPFLAGAVPTSRLELESAAIHRTGGNQDPARWTMDRTRYPEAWVLPEGHRAEATVIPGGEEVELTLTLRPIWNHPAPLTLIARTGSQEVGRLTLSPNSSDGSDGSDNDGHRHGSNAEAWQAHKLPAAPWTSDAPLVLEILHGDGEALPPNGVAIDRVDLRWH